MSKKRKQKSINKLSKKNQTIIGIALISLLCLIIGTLAIGFLLSFILIAIVDGVAYILLNRKGKTKRKKKISVGKIILLVAFSFGTLMLLLISCFFIWIAKNAKDFDPDKMYQKEATILYDNKGEIVAKLGIEKRENLSYEELPNVLIT